MQIITERKKVFLEGVIKGLYNSKRQEFNVTFALHNFLVDILTQIRRILDEKFHVMTIDISLYTKQNPLIKPRKKIESAL